MRASLLRPKPAIGIKPRNRLNSTCAAKRCATCVLRRAKHSEKPLFINESERVDSIRHRGHAQARRMGCFGRQGPDSGRLSKRHRVQARPGSTHRRWSSTSRPGIQRMAVWSDIAPPGHHFRHQKACRLPIPQRVQHVRRPVGLAIFDQPRDPPGRLVEPGMRRHHSPIMRRARDGVVRFQVEEPLPEAAGMVG